MTYQEQINATAKYIRMAIKNTDSWSEIERNWVEAIARKYGVNSAQVGSDICFSMAAIFDREARQHSSRAA